MHKGSLKKWALALTLWFAVHISPLRAQLLGPYGTSPITLEVDANGLLWVTGTLGTGSLSLSGGGRRMFWYPGKAAFRAGSVELSQWDDANIGTSSVAFGFDTTAAGTGSFAVGYASSASGQGSVAMGEHSSASGFYSTASGSYTSASGRYSTVSGYSSTATGDLSAAFNSGTQAVGDASVAFGNSTTASGFGSEAFGSFTSANGDLATAYGEYTVAQAYESFVLGRYNVGGGTAGQWVSTDIIFEIGNGVDRSHPHDALSVDKSGNVAASGVIAAQPGGDIPMYQGN